MYSAQSKISSFIVLLSASLLISGCAGRAYVVNDTETPDFLSRALTQKEAGITVQAAVPDADETAELFGLPLYGKKVQPVWLKIHNNSSELLRLTIWSVDPDYFSPLEVAWMFRNGYSAEGKAAIEKTLYNAALVRRIPAGETRSGFVYTHLKPGTKGFNIDLLSSKPDSHSFTFFVPMPGFLPDYMSVNLKDLYAPDEVRTLEADTLRTALKNLDCCATDESGLQSGTPMNIALVGTGVAVQRALLRSDWQETEQGSKYGELARQQFYKGRIPDGTFIKVRADGTERKELRLWKAPFKIDEKWVWTGQVVNVIADSIGKARKPLVAGDMDGPAIFLMQDLWYGQSLEAIGFVRTMDAVPADDPVFTFNDLNYFTKGIRSVLILSEDPVALNEVENLGWEGIPDE